MVTQMSSESVLLSATAVDHVQETPFYIPATGPLARPRRSLKSNDTFAVLDSFGDIGEVAAGPDGVFHCDTRYLSRLQLLIDGGEPLLLGASLRDDNSALRVDLTNQDIYFGNHLALARNTVHITRTTFLSQAMAYFRFGVRNHGTDPVELTLSLAFANDFADLFEVRGMQRARRGHMRVAIVSANCATLEYEGLDGRLRSTALQFDPPPDDLRTNLATYRLRLAPDARQSIHLAVMCDCAPPAPSFTRTVRSATRDLKTAGAAITAVESSNEVFNEVLCRSAADLAMLNTQTAQGDYPYAGIPWYSTTFGRDGLITAMELLWCAPDTARGVLRRLAAYQAKTNDPVADAQPGKILHEMRGGEMAALHEIPFGLYYGSVDSTPLFVWLAGLYAERSGDTELLRELWPNVLAALAWIDGPGDPDRDGFIEYQRANEEGLSNQGWKDSHDAIFHADGTLARAPIALVEVQGYVYAAKRVAARCARKLGHSDLADALDAQANELARRFDEAFWLPELGTYALALDGDKRPCRVRASNAGHALFTGIAKPERAASIAAVLTGADMFNGWGVRTLARREARYNPMAYHNGSVWPHDNALVALGLGRYGFTDAVERIFIGMFDAAAYMDFRRLPELLCGFRRRRYQGPILYPVACSPQAWSSATPFALLQAMLGFEFRPEQREIQLTHPRLPAFLERVILRNLRLGAQSVDLLVEGNAAGASVRVLRNDGDIRVVSVHA